MMLVGGVDGGIQHIVERASHRAAAYLGPFIALVGIEGSRQGGCHVGGEFAAGTQINPFASGGEAVYVIVV